MRAWKESIVEKLAGGITALAKRRNVEVMQGRGYFEDASTLRVETSGGQQFINFDQAIIAIGSKAAMPAAFDLGNPRVMTSTEALEIEEIPKDLLVVGGGYIGMELGTVYATLGSNIVVVEALDRYSRGARPRSGPPDPQSRPKRRLGRSASRQRCVKMATAGKQIKVIIEAAAEKKEELYDRVLVSVGRVPNCGNLGLENTNVKRDEKGFIRVDEHQRTAEPSIFAIGDVAGGVLLAHKASKEARIAVEVITGEKSVFEDIIIPAVVFTDPELAWCGLTEEEARATQTFL